MRVLSYDPLSMMEIAGHIVCHGWFGEPEISYWIGKEYGGQSVATRALEEFLLVLETRPLYARAAKDNIASIRVLEKSGFILSGIDKGFASARGEEIEEVVYCLRQKGEAGRAKLGLRMKDKGCGMKRSVLDFFGN